MLSLLFAQTRVVQPTGAAFGGMFPLILIFIIFYFLLIRPQQKRTKEEQKMRESLKKGDNVLTSGGIYGRIVNIKGSNVEIEIAPNCVVTFSKSAVIAQIK